jgi:homoserine kinase type II
MDLNQLWQHWSLSGPWTFRPVAYGANNLVQYVDTPHDGSFVLRVYRNHRNIKRINYELSLMLALQQFKLPFTVPTPLPARNGELLVRWVDAGLEYLVNLWPLVPGEHPERTNLNHARAAGTALGHLTIAMSQLSSDFGPTTSSPHTYGELHQVHPLVKEPLEALAALPLTTADIQRLSTLYKAIELNVPQLYSSLPTQIIHSDFMRGNLLMVGDRLTGVLDFEFACKDLRAMDFAIALIYWSSTLWGTGEEWPLMATFAEGYFKQQQLTLAEIEALPQLILLRFLTVVLHFIGLYRQGLATLEILEQRIQATFAIADWVSSNGAVLKERVKNWQFANVPLRES